MSRDVKPTNPPSPCVPRRCRSDYDYAIDGVKPNPIELVLEKLREKKCSTSSVSGGWSAQCPAHSDINPSLKVSSGDDGRVLLYCHAGCEFGDIVEALNLEESQLFPAPGAAARSVGRVRFKWDPAKDWSCQNQECERLLTPAQLNQLASDLGVHAASLKRLHVGWRGDPTGGVYTFPERSGTGAIVGLSTRTVDGVKSFVAGGHRGLSLPDGWEQREGPILIVEGASDTAALDHLGLCGIGRPSATGGIRELTELLRNQPRDRRIVVMGERDQKPDGRWPGQQGAVRVAEQLSAQLGRQIPWRLPPEGSKDVRTWLNAREDRS